MIFDVQHMWKSLGSSSYLLGTFEKKQNSAFDQAKAGMSSTEMGSSSRDIGVGTIEALVKAAKNILSTLWDGHFWLQVSNDISYFWNLQSHLVGGFKPPEKS